MIAIFLLFVSTAFSLDAVCTLPWLGDLTQRLAPDATVTVLARGNEDPHYLSPTPALIAKVGKADLYVENGMNLELWSERLLDGAGNPRIRRGQPGFVVASTGVPALEIPAELSRAQGDLHPAGNPHIWLDPLNSAIAADNIAAGLSRVDPANAAAYGERARAYRAEVYTRLFGEDLVGFMGGSLLDRLARSGKLVEFLEQKQLTGRLGGWLGSSRALDGKPVVFYHQSWAYLADRFGLEIVGTVEDRPGIAPSAAHRDQLAGLMKAKGVRVVGVASYYDERLARALAEQTGATVSTLPADVGGTPEAIDYFALIDAVLAGMAR